MDRAARRVASFLKEDRGARSAHGPETPALMLLLIDTGVLYAMIDRRDRWHRRVVDYVNDIRPSLLTPVTILPEAAYLVRTRLGASVELKMILGLAKGEVSIEPLKADDATRAAGLMAKYPQLGFVDATVVAIAERLALTTIATTDRRHFGLVRPAHTAQFAFAP